MKQNKYDEYKHQPNTLDRPKVSSVQLEMKHFEFIKANNINLSKLVRKLLNEMMGEES